MIGPTRFTPLGVVAILLTCWASIVQALGAEAPPAEPPGGEAELATEEIPEIAEATKRFKSGDFQGAKAVLDEAVKRDPQLPPAALFMVRLFAQANQPGAVQNWLQQTVIEVPEDPEAYLLLADMDFREGRWAQAGALYEESMERLETLEGDPRRKSQITERTLMGIAGLDGVRGDWSAAQKNLETVLADNPENTAAWEQLARALVRQKKPEDALSKLQAAAETDENMPAPEAVLAQLHEEQGDRDNATKWMIAALKARPRDFNTRLAAAQWALGIGEIVTAKQQADALLILKPDSLEAQVLRGVVAMFLNDHVGGENSAEKFFQKAYLQSPSNLAASNYLALALAYSGDPQQRRRAFDIAENNVRKNPNEPEVYSTLGWTLYKSGRLDEAERAFATAGSMGQLRPDTAFYWANLAADRGRNEQALQMLESALATSTPFATRDEAEDLLERLKPK
jgi:superkiller protein 3